jgi:hypothetical protein
MAEIVKSFSLSSGVRPAPSPLLAHVRSRCSMLFVFILFFGLEGSDSATIGENNSKRRRKRSTRPNQIDHDALDFYRVFECFGLSISVDAIRM